MFLLEEAITLIDPERLRKSVRTCLDIPMLSQTSPDLVKTLMKLDICLGAGLSGTHIHKQIMQHLEDTVGAIEEADFRKIKAFSHIVYHKGHTKQTKQSSTYKCLSPRLPP